MLITLLTEALNLSEFKQTNSQAKQHSDYYYIYICFPSHYNVLAFFFFLTSMLKKKPSPKGHEKDYCM